MLALLRMDAPYPGHMEKRKHTQGLHHMAPPEVRPMWRYRAVDFPYLPKDIGYPFGKEGKGNAPDGKK